MEEINIRNAYSFISLCVVLLYIISYFGLWSVSPTHVYILNEIYKIFIALVLIYFFNPWSKEKLNDFHKKIAFSAGFLLILTSSISGIFKSIPIIRKIPYFNKILSAKKLVI